MKALHFLKLLCLVAAISTLQACANIHRDFLPPPDMANVGNELDMESVLVTPLAEEPIPDQRVEMSDNSIWNKRDSMFFRDTRAFEVGDILTVRISIDNSAKINSDAERELANSGGISGSLTADTPIYSLPSATLDGSISRDFTTKLGGSVNRSEKIQFQIAAAVVEASANGNLKIFGTQEVRVNAELRIMRVEGIVRSKDIAPDNTIPYEKIAEARISYGGYNSRGLTRKKRLNRFLSNNLPRYRGGQ